MMEMHLTAAFLSVSLISVILRLPLVSTAGALRHYSTGWLQLPRVCRQLQLTFQQSTSQGADVEQYQLNFVHMVQIPVTPSREPPLFLFHQHG